MRSRIQHTVAMFTTEAEYMAVIEAAKKALKLTRLVKSKIFSKMEFYCIVTVKVPFTW